MGNNGDGSSKKIKEVQNLNGRVATLIRFVSRAMDKCLPFFKVLRKAFEWIDKCQKAFEELKTYLASPCYSVHPNLVKSSSFT